MLFKSLSKPDRQQTQLAYRIKYWPAHELSPVARDLLASNKSCFLRKHMIESVCDETKETLIWRGNSWRIVWAYNNPPTEEEWSKKGENFLIQCEFRQSPTIPEFRVVILNFGLPSDMLRPTAPAITSL
jgi:hypothetical protein